MKRRNTMDKFESLSHTAWNCKYYVVFIPKCRRRTLYGQLRQHLGGVFRKLAAPLAGDAGDVSMKIVKCSVLHRNRSRKAANPVPGSVSVPMLSPSSLS